jgi:glutathione S-transferase
MAEIAVYGIPGSPLVRAALLGLEEKGVPYRLQALSVGENRGEAHLARHPFGRVPVIEHGDFRLYETQAILRYVDAAFPGPALQPTEPRAAARMNQVMGISDWYVFRDIGVGIVFQRIVGPILLGRAADEAVIREALPKAQVCIGELERLLGDQPYFVGEMPSIADLMLAPQLDYFAATPEGGVMLARTSLAAWLERMNARPSMRATLPPAALRSAA